jgi:hypothetical protein
MRKLLMAAAVVAAALVPSLSHAAPATTNLALGSVATASSQESSAYPGSLAVDGDATTRWSSAFSDPQTLEHIGANDPLRIGSYSAPVTFTLATTHP